MKKRSGWWAAGLAIMLAAAGCSSSGSARRAHTALPTSQPSAATPTTAPTATAPVGAQVPNAACQVFPLQLAQSIEPTLTDHGAQDGDASSGIAECDYQVQTASDHGEDLTFEVVSPASGSTPVPVAAVPNEYATASDQYVSSRSMEVSGLGDAAVFVYAARNGGGSEQNLTWTQGSLSISIDYSSSGPGGITQDRSAAIIAAGRQVSQSLG